DDGLRSLRHRDVLHGDCLLSAAPIAFERFQLSGIGSSELVQRARSALPLREILSSGKVSSNLHHGRMNGGHLSELHRPDLVSWRSRFDRTKHEQKAIPIKLVDAPATRTEKLIEKAFCKMTICRSEHL